MSGHKYDALVAGIKAVGTPKDCMEKTASLKKLAIMGKLKGLYKGIKAGLRIDDPKVRTAAQYMGIAAGVGAVGSLGAHVAGKGIHSIESAVDYKTSKKRLRAYDPELFKGANNTQVAKTYLRTLSRLAPTLARDPVVSSSWVRRLKEMPETALGMAKEIAGAEDKLRILRGDKLSSKIPNMMPSFSGPGFKGIE